jgi:hypothetical protein
MVRDKIYLPYEMFQSLVLTIPSEKYMPLKLPLLPLHLLKIRNYNVAVIVGTVGQMVYYALNVLWPQQIAALYTTNNGLIGWMSVSFASQTPRFFIRHSPYLLVHNGCFIGGWRDVFWHDLQLGWPL